MNYTIKERLDFARPNVGYEDLKGVPVCGCCRTYFVVSQEEREEIKEIVSDMYEALKAWLGFNLEHPQTQVIEQAQQALRRAEGKEV